jgi:hypothetical protein
MRGLWLCGFIIPAEQRPNVFDRRQRQNRNAADCAYDKHPFQHPYRNQEQHDI